MFKIQTEAQKVCSEGSQSTQIPGIRFLLTNSLETEKFNTQLRCSRLSRFNWRIWSWFGWTICWANRILLLPPTVLLLQNLMVEDLLPVLRQQPQLLLDFLHTVEMALPTLDTEMLSTVASLLDVSQPGLRPLWQKGVFYDGRNQTEVNKPSLFTTPDSISVVRFRKTTSNQPINQPAKTLA